MTQSWIEARVTAKGMDAQSVAILELAGANNELPGFSAGSHIDIEIEPGLIRQYSLCNNPRDEGRYVIAVLREEQSRGGSKALFDDIQVGNVLKISAPRNHFQLLPTSPRNLLFAAGIGITPLLSMAEWLSYVGGDFHLHYSAKSRARAAFADHISGSPYASKTSFHFSDGPQQQKLDLASALTLDGYSHVYVCGPEHYMTAVLNTARQVGWPNNRLHREYFAAAAIQGDDVEFTIRIASTGQSFVVPPSVSLAQVLRSNGIEVPLSCEQGLCGACLTRVLEGVLDHRDHFLTPDEQAANDQFTACCSRAKGTVVLDI